MLTQHCFHKTKIVYFFTDFLRNRLYMHESNTNHKKSLKYVTNSDTTRTLYMILMLKSSSRSYYFP